MAFAERPAWASRVVLGVAVVLLAIGGLARPVEAENACVQANPTYVHQVQGFTWIGIVTAFDRVPYQGQFRTVVSFRVQSVFAGSSVRLRTGGILTLPSGPCGRFTGLRPGDEYLVSTNRISNRSYSSESLAAWQIDGDAARFVVMHPQAAVPRQLQQATTLEAALKLVAPEAILPPTSAFGSSESASSGSAVEVIPGLITLLAASLVGFSLRRRLRTIARQGIA